jgi:hypothetical protein
MPDAPDQERTSPQTDPPTPRAPRRPRNRVGRRSYDDRAMEPEQNPTDDLRVRKPGTFVTK